LRVLKSDVLVLTARVEAVVTTIDPIEGSEITWRETVDRGFVVVTTIDPIEGSNQGTAAKPPAAWKQAWT
jgi:hypothetical protein